MQDVQAKLISGHTKPVGPHFSSAHENRCDAQPILAAASSDPLAGRAPAYDDRNAAASIESAQLPDRAANASGASTIFRDCRSARRRLRLDRVTRSTFLGAAEHPEETPDRMPVRGISDRLSTLLATARRVLHETESDGVLLMAECPFDWVTIREKLGHCKLLVATTGDAATPTLSAEDGDAAAATPEDLDGIRWIHLEESEGPTHDRLTMALLEAVADEHLRPGASVVALYRGFDDEEIDSLSVIRLDEHLEKLTAADLRKLETQVPLDTLKAVVDLAVDIGREGREGHPVGTMFVVGDTRKVMKQSRPMGFDPFHGYSPKEKSLRDRRVREELKEIAQLDGAFIIDAAGDVVAARRYIDSPASGITMSKGLGSRHWAAASVTKSTKAIAIVVSQSSGTVRIFQNGQIVLRVEPLRRAMKWQEFESQPQPPEWLA